MGSVRAVHAPRIRSRETGRVYLADDLKPEDEGEGESSPSSWLMGPVSRIPAAVVLRLIASLASRAVPASPRGR